MTKTIYINGKFFAQPLTGVQRFGIEVVRSLDALIDEGLRMPSGGIELLVPDVPTLDLPVLHQIRVTRMPATNLHRWEQFTLPSYTRGHLLINLAGSAPLLKRNQVCTFHDAAVFDVPQAYSARFIQWYSFLFRVQAKVARRLLTVSDFSRQRLALHLRTSVERIGIVPNGADHVLARQPDEQVLTRLQLLGRRYLLAVGSTHPAKNFARLLQAMQACESLQVPLVVVGGTNAAVFAGGDLPAQSPNIIRAGRVTDDQLIALYQHAEAFVFPSLYEGFGIPPLEAMAVGCPVLAAHAASIPEVCGEGAAYFDPLSVESIRDQLLRAVSDRPWLDNLRAAGRERVAQFTWRQSAHRLVEQLQQLGAL